MKDIFLPVMFIACFAVVTAAQRPTVTAEPYFGGNRLAGVLSVPEYPSEGIGKGIDGVVMVAITVDEVGKVISAKATSGPANSCEGVTDPTILAFRRVAVEAALKSSFSPYIIDERPKQVTGVIRYDFEQGTNKADPDKMTIAGLTAASQSDNPSPDVISGAVLNGKALTLPKPPYPPAARAVPASGAVGIQVLIDEEGNVFSARAATGHPLLRAASQTAACGAKFSPTLLYGKPVKVSGIITYNFVP